MNPETAVTQRPPNQIQQTQQVQEAKGEILYTPFASADPIKLSIAIVKKWLCKPTKSGAICTDSDAMRFMMMCQARRLNPFEGDAHLVGYDGRNGPEFSLITAHQALNKRAEPQPSFKGLDSGVIVSPGWPCRACESGFKTLEDGAVTRCPVCRGTGVFDEVQGDFVPEGQKLVGGWAHLVRSDRDIPFHRRLSLESYKPEYPNKFWTANPAGQISKCAEADCLRSAYPTLVGGLYTENESGFAMVTREISNGAAAALSAPPPQTTRALAAPAATTRVKTPPRRGPTLVEEPLSADEAAEAAMGLAPEQREQQAEPEHTAAPVTPPAAVAELTPQSQLEEIVTGAGFTFDQFKRWGDDTQGAGNSATGMLAWDTYGSFTEVPSKAAAFFVRAKTGMLAGLKGGGM